jgi:hypothetical protein
MPKRIVYHLVYKDKKWRVEKEKAKQAAYVSDDRERAMKKAKQLAKKHTLGQLKVHTRDGRIQIEYTYGQDPERYPG